MPDFTLRLPRLPLPRVPFPRFGLPKVSFQPTTIAGSAALATLAYNLAVVFLPLPELRIATAEALTLGLGAAGAGLLATRPRFRAAAVYSAIGIAIACLFVGVWHAGKSGTPLPRLGLDFLAATGLAALTLPLRSARANARPA